MGSRAEEIARELGRLTSEASAAETTAAEASVGERELVMKLLNGTASYNVTASWLGEANPQRDKSAAQAAFEKRGGRLDASIERIDRIDGGA